MPPLVPAKNDPQHEQYKIDQAKGKSWPNENLEELAAKEANKLAALKKEEATEAERQSKEAEKAAKEKAEKDKKDKK